MGWGPPNSPGHYLDLLSAILAGVLLPLGLLGQLMIEQEHAARAAGCDDYVPEPYSPRQLLAKIQQCMPQ